VSIADREIPASRVFGEALHLQHLDSFEHAQSSTAIHRQAYGLMK
jgi:hypothetical protein